MEFVGPGIASLRQDTRNAIDAMTTETTCLSSIWETDDQVKHYYDVYGRPEAFKALKPGNVAYYDSMIHIELDKMESMIALPFHPSKAHTIHEFQKNPKGFFIEGAVAAGG